MALLSEILTSALSGPTGATGPTGASGAGGGSSITVTNDTSTNSDLYYPSMIYNVTSGAYPSTAYVSSSKLYFNPSTGQFNATYFNSLSDVNFKHNIQNIENALEIIEQLRGVSFNWNDTGKKSFGIIAQQLETVIPELVNTNENGDKSVNYDGLIAFLICAVNSLSKKIKDNNA